MARVPFAALPDDPVVLGALLEAAIRDTRWALHPSSHPRWAPGVVEDEVSHSAVILLQSTEVLPPPPVEAPHVAGAPHQPPWPPPVSLAERTEVFLSTGSVAALGDRPQ